MNKDLEKLVIVTSELYEFVKKCGLVELYNYEDKNLINLLEAGIKDCLVVEKCLYADIMDNYLKLYEIYGLLLDDGEFNLIDRFDKALFSDDTKLVMLRIYNHVCKLINDYYAKINVNASSLETTFDEHNILEYVIAKDIINSNLTFLDIYNKGGNYSNLSNVFVTLKYKLAFLTPEILEQLQMNNFVVPDLLLQGDLLASEHDIDEETTKNCKKITNANIISEYMQRLIDIEKKENIISPLAISYLSIIRSAAIFLDEEEIQDLIERLENNFDEESMTNTYYLELLDVLKNHKKDIEIPYRMELIK